MKEKQEEFELRLLDERNRLKNEYERNIKQAKSSGWDSLKSQQQLTLQNLGVPTFCLTKDLVILKRQHQVLEVILSSLNDRETNLNSEE
ncbi:hypothetical protein DFH28DRAFT_959693 [Melampsora americana]|nr:hypothetical protein DFH28DRAFT_959693 [Melampsora americana]